MGRHVRAPAHEDGLARLRQRVDVALTIGIRPCSTEEDLLRLLGMAIVELRGRPPSTPMPDPEAWLM
jgi:hypothetical protein